MGSSAYFECRQLVEKVRYQKYLRSKKVFKLYSLPINTVKFRGSWKKFGTVFINLISYLTISKNKIRSFKKIATLYITNKYIGQGTEITTTWTLKIPSHCLLCNMIFSTFSMKVHCTKGQAYPCRDFDVNSVLICIKRVSVSWKQMVVFVCCF